MTDRRALEPVDVAAAAGALATFFGASLLFLSTEGRFQPPSQSPIQPMTADVKDLIEPAIGGAVVTASVIENQHRADISKATAKLQTKTMAAERLSSSGNERIEELVNETNEQEEQKTARVEFVKGKSIVNFTSRGKREHPLPVRQWDAFNERMIGVAAGQERRIEGEFRANRPNMATVLATETESQTAAFRKNQEEVGAAVVKVVVVQDQYKRAMDAIQQQVGALVSTAAVAEQL